jgi:hypothetical protein
VKNTNGELTEVEIITVRSTNTRAEARLVQDACGANYVADTD